MRLSYRYKGGLSAQSSKACALAEVVDVPLPSVAYTSKAGCVVSLLGAKAQRTGNG